MLDIGPHAARHCGLQPEKICALEGYLRSRSHALNRLAGFAQSAADGAHDPTKGHAAQKKGQPGSATSA